MPYRVIFKWDALAEDNRGWTENFWCNSADLTVVRAAALALRVKLEALKGNQAYCAKFVLQNMLVRRAALPVKVLGAGPSNVGNPPNAFDGDNPVSALRIRLSGDGVQYTQQWLRGVPDAIITQGGVYTPGGLSTYQTRVNDFFGLLTAGLWSVNVLNPLLLQKTIIAIDPATGIVTSEAHGFETGDRVRIQFVRGLTAANGIWKIVVLSPTTFQLQQWVPTAVPMVKSPTATARKQQYVLQRISAGKIVEASSHYTGGPTGRRTGRRRKKKV